MSELERWFSEAGAPPRLDLARSGAPPLAAKDILMSASPDDMDEYLGMSLDYGPAAGSPRLRSAISAAFGGAPGDVIVTNGALEALVLACAATVGDRRVVAVAAPGYPGLFRAVDVSGAECRPVTVWRPGLERLDLSALGDQDLRGVAAVIVNTPHNPTGVCADPAELADLSHRCHRAGAALIVDQVSIGTLDPWAESVGRWHHASSASASLIWIGDVSKALGMGGLRVGWCATANTAWRDRMTSLRDVLTLSNATPAQHLAAVALEHRHAFAVTELARRNRARLGQMVDDLAGASWEAPSDGLVAFPRLPLPGCSRAFADRLRATAGVSVTPGAFFGHDRHLRLGLGLGAQEFDLGISRLCEALSGGGSASHA